jgi:hypothetical protein
MTDDLDRSQAEVRKLLREIEKIEAETEKLKLDVKAANKTRWEKGFDWLTKGGAAALTLIGIAAGIYGLGLSDRHNKVLEGENKLLLHKQKELLDTVEAEKSRLLQLKKEEQVQQRTLSELQLAVKNTGSDLALIQQQISDLRPKVAQNQVAAAIVDRAAEDASNLRTNLSAAAKASARAGGSLSTSSTDVDAMRSAIARLFADDASTRTQAYAEIVERFGNAKELPSALIAHARQNKGNGNGVYNALVVLSHVDLKKLDADIAEIRAFAGEARAISPRTAARADVLLSRL